MEFRQLEYFVTISELENFTRTAEVLHVSQPSVTKAIKSLEGELKLTLIDRSQKHVQLTEEGRTFLIHAQRIMRDVQAAYQDMQRFHSEARGTIRFGIPPMVEGYLFPDFFTKFRTVYPDITLDVQELSDSMEVREQADLGELDFGIVLASPDDVVENEFLIMKDEMGLCLPEGHPLAALETVPFGRLRREKFIMQQPHTFQYQSVFDCCTQHGFTPDIVLSTSQLKTIKQLVANGTGIAILPKFVTHGEKIFARRDTDPSIDLHISLYWGSHKTFSAIDNRFMDFMRHYTSTPDFKKHFFQK